MIGGDLQYFQSQNQKLDQIKKQLDSNNVKDKFVGMKKVVAMMSKGNDVEELFPYVVKNVVCKHLDVKKLVYTYLIHYAEKRQDDALLAINNFQKDLSDKNQFFRALALRVLSSIRIADITKIIVAVIKKCSTDMSPFVRKAACLAIPKAYSLDPLVKEELVGVIEKLLGDSNTMVLGAAVFAFNEVCPNDWNLIHPQYRKLCKYLVDCDEWGQVVIINMLLRYARTQFTSPYKDDENMKKSFYDEEEGDPLDEASNPIEYDVDADHRLLLRATAPLLRTCNSAVVLAVASLYFHIAPRVEAGKVVKALLRIAAGPREAKFVILSNIASFAKDRPEVFEPFIKDFYVYMTDGLAVKKLKLEILSLLATEANAHALIKEFKSYVRFPEEEFVAEAIQALGRIASAVPEITETCIAGLLSMIRNKHEKVVAESVIVIRYLLQKSPREHSKIIAKIATLLEHIKVPVARASIVWMIGEYYDIIPSIGPDALRILAKNFINEDDSVKLQTLTLGTKLYLRTGEKIGLLFQYVLNLARYDQNYDIRDRARLIRAILFNPKGNCTVLTQRANDIFFGEKKMAATLMSNFHERSRFALSSMSHLVNHAAFGYEGLPEFPAKQPDPTVRDTPMEVGAAVTDLVDDKEVDEDKFYAEKQGGEDAEEDLDNFYGDEDDPFADIGEDEEEEEEEVEEGDEEEEEVEEEEVEEEEVEEEEVEEGEEEEYEEEEVEEEEEEELPKPAPRQAVKSPVQQKAQPAKQQNLLDMTEQFFGSSQSGNDQVLTPTRNVAASSQNSQFASAASAASVELPRKVLLNPAQAQGLSIEYQFRRELSNFGVSENVVRLFLKNTGASVIEGITIDENSIEKGRAVNNFDTIAQIAPNGSVSIDLSIEFNLQATELRFTVQTKNKGFYSVSIAPVIGELLHPMPMNMDRFNKEKKDLGSLNSESDKVAQQFSSKRIVDAVLAIANVAVVSATDSELCFAAKTRAQVPQVVLVHVTVANNQTTVTGYSEKTLFAHSICSAIVKQLSA